MLQKPTGRGLIRVHNLTLFIPNDMNMYNIIIGRARKLSLDKCLL